MNSAPLFTINSLWIGKSLPMVEQICVASMQRQGHKVRIFSYEPIDNLPAGVIAADANEIIPESEILIYSRENFKYRQMASNIFRYRMLQHNLGIWLDLDMLLLKPILACNKPVFGLETSTSINNAVLYIPPEHRLLKALIKFTSTAYPVPPYFPWRLRLKLWQAHRRKQPIHVTDMPWGVFGPQALTYHAKKLGLLKLANPIDVFYPTYYLDAHGPLTAGWDVASRLTARTIGIHLWSHNLREPSALRPAQTKDEAVIEPGSFLAEFANHLL